MLAWFTFAAAAIGAVGAILGPILAVRTSAARRQQEDVDRYVEFAISSDRSIRGLGITHLNYLLQSGQLTPAQANAAAAAVAAAVAKADDRVRGHPTAAVAQVDERADGEDGESPSFGEAAILDSACDDEDSESDS